MPQFLTKLCICCSYINRISKKLLIMILKNGFNSQSDWTNNSTTLIPFINKTPRFSPIFGFSLVGSNVSSVF